MVLRFFDHLLEDPAYWLQVIPHIYAIINNSFSLTTKKTSNKVAYNFSPRHPLDFLAAVPTPDILTARSDVTEAILFALLNQKMAYECRHQPLFIKVGKWTLL